MHYEPVSGPGAWYGRDLAPRDDWIHVFSAAQIREIEAAVAGARVPLAELTPKAFPLPSVGPFLRRVLAAPNRFADRAKISLLEKSQNNRVTILRLE